MKNRNSLSHAKCFLRVARQVFMKVCPLEDPKSAFDSSGDSSLVC